MDNVQNNEQKVWILDADGIFFEAAEVVREQKFDKYGVFFLFLHILRSIINRQNIKKLAVVWDSPKIKKREIYPEYRKRRIEPIQFDPEQFSLILEILGYLGISQFQCDGFESDEIIAAIANLFPSWVIISDDKDFFQLVNENKEVLARKRVVKKWDGKMVKKFFKLVDPSLFADYLALKGDPIDNIPRIFPLAFSRRILNKMGPLKDWLFKDYYKNLSPEMIDAIKAKKDEIKRNLLLTDLREMKFEDKFIFNKYKKNLKKAKAMLQKYGFKRLLTEKAWADLEKWQNTNIIPLIKKKKVSNLLLDKKSLQTESAFSQQLKPFFPNWVGRFIIAHHWMHQTKEKTDFEAHGFFFKSHHYDLRLEQPGGFIEFEMISKPTEPFLTVYGEARKKDVPTSLFSLAIHGDFIKKRCVFGDFTSLHPNQFLFIQGPVFTTGVREIPFGILEIVHKGWFTVLKKNESGILVTLSPLNIKLSIRWLFKNRFRILKIA